MEGNRPQGDIPKDKSTVLLFENNSDSSDSDREFVNQNENLTNIDNKSQDNWSLILGYYHVNENPSNLISTSAAPFQLTTMKTKYPMQVSEVVQVIESAVQNDTKQRSYDTDELS